MKRTQVWCYPITGNPSSSLSPCHPRAWLGPCPYNGEWVCPCSLSHVLHTFSHTMWWDVPFQYGCLKRGWRWDMGEAVVEKALWETMLPFLTRHMATQLFQAQMKLKGVMWVVCVQTEVPKRQCWCQWCTENNERKSN